MSAHDHIESAARVWSEDFVKLQENPPAEPCSTVSALTGFDPSRIERGIPMPPRTHGSGQARLYPFSDLEIGDSFVMGEYSRKLVQRAGSSCAHYGKRLGRKFSVRRCGSVLRVWRTA